MGDRSNDTTSSALRLVELAEWMRATEIRALHGQTILPGVDPDLPATAAVHIPAADIAELKTIADALSESVEVLTQLTDGVVERDIEIRWVDLEQEAAEALEQGVADIDRVHVLVRCLTVKEGLRALAEMLRSTDVHHSWHDTTLGDVLGSFRHADEHFVRRLTARAHLSPGTMFAACDPEQIARLADVLADHAATPRCR